MTHLRDLYPIMRERLEAKAGCLAARKWLSDPKPRPPGAGRCLERLKLRKTHPKWVASLYCRLWHDVTRRHAGQRVMKDDALYEVAAVAPLKPDDLSGLRDLPSQGNKPPTPRDNGSHGRPDLCPQGRKTDPATQWHWSDR